MAASGADASKINLYKRFLIIIHMTGFKGQSQLLIILGILVFAIVVVLFATNTINLLPPETTEITQLKESLRADVEQRLRGDAFEVVKKVSEQGGYWLASPQSVSYKGADVAYWKLGKNSLARTRQDVASEIETGLKDSIASLDSQDLSTKIGKKVTVGSFQGATVQIKDNEVVLSVNIPISLEGYPLRTPIEVSVPAKLGEALDFANQITDIQTKSNDQDDGKLFEKFLAISILGYQSQNVFGPKVPSIGILEGCGKFFHKDWFSVRPEMEALVRGVLANTFTAGNVPENIGDKSQYPGHVLPVLTSLKTKFVLGESLDENNFQMAPNPVEVRTSAPTYVPVCVSNPYRVDYWMLLPVVAELKDEDYRFQFAFQVFLLGYEPGDDEDLNINLDAWKEQLLTCKNALCDGKIKVTDINGPVELATVSYAGCNLGITNTQGVVETKIPCGISLLEVSKSGYTQYKDLYSSEELKDKNIYFNTNKIPSVKLNLYNLVLQKIGDTYTVKDVKPNDKELAISVVSGEVNTFGYVSLSEETNSSFLATSTPTPCGPNILLDDTTR